MGKLTLKKIENSFWGGVLGDVIGTPIEFIDYDIVDNFGPITTVLNNKKRGIVAGMYSDDTCMTLALMDSLITTHRVDLNDQMLNYNMWLNNGKYSCVSYSYGSGSTTRKAINYFCETGCFRDNSSDNFECGNGSLMRTAPIIWALFQCKNKRDVLDICDKCSTTTHNHILCRYVCRMFGSILYDILNGKTNKTLLVDNCFNDVLCGFRLKNPIDYYNYSELLKVIYNHYTDTTPLNDGDKLDPNYFNPMVLYKENKKVTGYAPVTLMCALWAFLTTDNFYDGLIKAVNIPGDCDTIGSVYGQIAGAYYTQLINNNKIIGDVTLLPQFGCVQNKEYLYSMLTKFTKTNVRINDKTKKRINHNKSTK